MVAAYRTGDRRFPFLRETGPQPPARWHTAADAPVTYCADTPDGAWAEFLRHEGIADPADLDGIAARLWALELDDAGVAAASTPTLPAITLTGGGTTYPACQAEARRLRSAGATMIEAPSAALLPGGAGGQVVAGGLRDAPMRDGRVWVLCGGAWPTVRGWVCVDAGAPAARLIPLVRPLAV